MMFRPMRNSQQQNNGCGHFGAPPFFVVQLVPLGVELLFRVTCHPIVGNKEGFDVATVPDLDTAFKLVDAIFQATKMCAQKPVEMRKRAIPVGAAIEFFYPVHDRFGVSRSNFLMYFRCQEIEDGK